MARPPAAATPSTGGSNGTGGTSSGNADASLDGACAASSTGAAPVPLDLYFLMDSSLSMKETTGAGTTKWSAVSAALSAFFTDSGSAGLGVALKYFPDEQSAPPTTCAIDSQCTVGGTSYGACDRRNTCVGANKSTTSVTPLCLTASDCSGGTPQCDLIQQCGTNSYCAADGTGTCDASCTTFPGYCHLRDICTSSEYATPNVAVGTLPRRGRGPLDIAIGAHARRLHADRAGAGRRCLLGAATAD